MKRILVLLAVAASVSISCNRITEQFKLQAGDSVHSSKLYSDFQLNAQFLAGEDAAASVIFSEHHYDSLSRGYKVVLHNGPIDGTLKTGSLYGVRNLYRSLAEDGTWADLAIRVYGKNISISVNGVRVVNYTEPSDPWRTESLRGNVLDGLGGIVFECEKGEFKFRNVSIDEHPALAEGERLPEAPDEQNDRIIRLQQEFFPVIDYHVHLKGGLTKEMAHEMSMQYGINYGVAPNAGEGGVGRMLADDAEVYDYFEEVKPLPFLCGVQGEGRKWTRTFSQEALGVFDYLFTDAMTIKDHKGRNARIYRPEEVHYDGITLDGYMEQIVDQTVKILSNEPADIYANPTFLPDALNAEYEKYWTDDRIDRVLDVLEKYNIALEINPRYRIPSFKIISMAKERGIKFTFGTNNVDADFGRLEYCIEAIDSCGIAASDIWFPSLSTRKDRPVILY